jgi:rubrerythrin
MGFKKSDKDKEFVCRQCSTYLDQNDLIDGGCPNCKNDEDVFMNSEDG